MLLGCIGDDFTGSSDLANTLAKQGMKVVQYSGVPSEAAGKDVEASVISLKSRSISSDMAVKQSLEAFSWLESQGCEQYFFKYCSTFDSTPTGNIGPVIDALADVLKAYKVIVCPAFPGAGRSVYQGHLFVKDTLLNESGMENHPLTPMTDSDIRRWLSLQTTNPVGHVAATTVLAGAQSIEKALESEHAAGNRLIVVDAMRDEDLIAIGKAADGLPLITGGSGIALGLPANFSKHGKISGKKIRWTGEPGKCVALSGSCSTATRGQVLNHKKANPTYELRADAVIEGNLLAETVLEWVLNAKGVPLVYSSADPEIVSRVQKTYGRERSANAIELFFAKLGRLLVDNGVRKILTAGGETSGAVVEGLQLKRFEIGPEIDPGVPALRASSQLVMALKSGNFGAEDYFVKAANLLAKEDVS